jgi:TPR repeat protein
LTSKTKPESDLESAYVKAQSAIEVGADAGEAVEALLNLAETGYVPAMNYVGNLYSAGILVELDRSKAFRWWRRGAAKGDICSMLNMGTDYRDKLSNNRQATFWLRRAAERGDSDAYLELAVSYYEIDKNAYVKKILQYLDMALSPNGLLSENSRERAETLRTQLSTPVQADRRTGQSRSPSHRRDAC